MNRGSDPAVNVTSSQLLDGATSGTVIAQVNFFNNLGLVDDLLAGEFYLNIHSQTFTGGELRGLLVAVLEPTTLGLLGCALNACALVRRRTVRGIARAGDNKKNEAASILGWLFYAALTVKPCSLQAMLA